LCVCRGAMQSIAVHLALVLLALIPGLNHI